MYVTMSTRYIVKIMYLQKSKRLIIWNGGSSHNCLVLPKLKSIIVHIPK